jgi:hypothetical protein
MTDSTYDRTNAPPKSRSPSWVLGLTLTLFALLDASHHITSTHLHAALSLWRYIEDCTRHIFAEVCLSPKALRLWSVLEHGPLNITQIHDFFSRNLRTGELDLLLKELTPRIEVIPVKPPAVRRW